MHDSKSNKYRFPWQTGNQFELLVDGPVFFTRMLDCIDRAEESVMLEMYLAEPGYIFSRFEQSLFQAVRRGVNVYLLLDDYGCSTITAQHRKRLQDHGVHLAIYNPLSWKKRSLLLFRDHRKILVVDGRTAYVGGAGLTDTFDSMLNPERNWHDIMIRIEGDNVADWQQLFIENWQRWSAIDPVRHPPAAYGHSMGRVTIAQGPDYLEIKRSFLGRIQKSHNLVWLATPYFAPSRKLRRALKRAARNGVDVRLLVPGSHTDHPFTRMIARNYYPRLIKNRVRIFEYQPRFIHTKIVIIDDWVSAGSCNLDHWNFQWNLDANQETLDADFASQARALFVEDFGESREVTLDDWKKLSIMTRLNIRLWGWLARRILHLTRQLKLFQYWKTINRSERPS